MGFFSNITKSIGEVFDDVGSGLENVFTGVESTIFGSDSDRGSRIGSLIGSQFGPIGSAIGSEVGSDISQRVSEIGRREITSDDVKGPVTQADYDSIQALRDQMDIAEQQPVVTPGQYYFDSSEVLTAGLPAIAGQMAQRVPSFISGAAVGGAMDIIDQVSEFFTGSDDATSGQMMCPTPARQRAFTVNRQTGCISITRKQQAKLKELVRMVGIEQASKSVGLPVKMVSELLMKTFRQRRRGISGADIKAVKRVDRQMHSLACALGGISQTSRAVASRKSPAKRSC